MRFLPIHVLFASAMLLFASGCHVPQSFFEGTGGSLEVESLGVDRVRLTGEFAHAYYANGNDVETSFYLSTVPIEQLLDGEASQAQIVRIDLLWRPMPGRTPLAATASNASIRHIIISNGEVGIYGGSGFARPLGKPGDDSLTINLREASLQLLDSTDGFIDLLAPARISGTFSAVHDRRETRRMYYALSQVITDAFGESRYVRGDESDTHAAAAINLAVSR